MPALNNLGWFMLVGFVSSPPPLSEGGDALYILPAADEEHEFFLLTLELSANPCISASPL